MAWSTQANVSDFGQAIAAGLPFDFGGVNFGVSTPAGAVEAGGIHSTVTEPPTTTTADDLSSFNFNFSSFGVKVADKAACGHFTFVDGKWSRTADVVAPCQFWTEGVLSTSVASFGLVGNLLSIWVLSVPEMRCTAFNRLLLALACIDCLFIVPGILIYVFEAFKLHANWYNYIFPTFLQPCAEIALCSSIYMTVAIAVERFIGLCRPFRRLSSRPCPAKAYILPVLGISVLVNIPKFLESETFKYTDQMCNQTTEICYNITRTVVSVTTLRTDPNYITYYTMWTRLLITGIFPLAMLAILNTKIYLALRKSKAQLRSLAIRAALPMAILGKPATPPSQMDLRIDSTNNWTPTANGGGPPPHGNHVNNGGIGMTTPLNPLPPANQQTPPPPAKSPKPHPMNRSVSAAVVESRNLLQPLTRSHSTSAAGTPVRATNGHAVQSNGGTTTASGSGGAPSGANTDLTLAPILFGVVIVFVICHTLRVFLNIYDFSVADEIISCEMKGVGRWPAPWFICLTYVNQLMIMINSSVNFLVYCVAGSKFRTILYQQLSSVFKQLRRQRPPERLHLQHQQGPRNNLLPNSRNLSSRLPNFNNGHNHHHHHETALLQPSYSNTRNGGRLITSAGPRGHLHQFHQHPRILELNENQV